MAAVVLGLVLRVLAAAGGALWTDEAWSALHATEVGTPLGVFLFINHDNNHHLYSLWLQAIGLQAPPLLARGPAIAAGTLTSLVAALIGARRSAAAAVVAALLFAVAPILVTYGSEARGYAPMLLAAIVMLLMLDKWLDGESKEAPVLGLAILAFLGMLSHLTMAAFVGLLAFWVFAVRRSERGPSEALRTTIKVMGPPLVACAAVVVGVFAAANASPEGMRVGGYSPFTLDRYALAMSDLSATTIGIPLGPWWLGPVLFGLIAVWILVRPPKWVGRWRLLLPLLILSVPLGVAVTRSGNPEFARYYLSSAVGVLLLASIWIGREMRAPAIRSALALAVLTIMVGGGLWGDAQLIKLRRGDPDRPLQIIQAQSTNRPTVAFAEERLKAVLIAAGERRGYRFTTASGCDPAEYLLGARWSLMPVRKEVVRCDTTWLLIDYGNSGRLSGEGWALYRSERLQSVGVAGSGPPPARESRKRHERA
jgi:Dolichyl-phosphate-mannose-protein mannosyltransferase